MKKTLLFVLAAALVAGTAPAAMASTPALTTRAEDISFDGYCDGLHLNFPSQGLPGTPFTVDGYQTGCGSGGVFGVAKPSHRGSYGVDRGVEFLTVPEFGTHTVVKRNHTWIHYGLEGNHIYILNSGTWSPGPPPPLGGDASNRPAARPHRIAGADVLDRVKDIAFDGYCDGMQLVSPSAGLGTAKTVDGNRNGCSSDPLMGSKNNIDEMGGTYVVSFFADGFQWLETAIFPDYTWVHYAVDGNLIHLLNSGTWSPGPPPIGAPAKSSTS